MKPEEQAKYYKDLFTRSKKLIIHYEENLKTKDNAIKSLKDKLVEYEAGILIFIILEDGKKCEFIFKFKYDTTNFFFLRSENFYVRLH